MDTNLITNDKKRPNSTITEQNATKKVKNNDDSPINELDNGISVLTDSDVDSNTGKNDKFGSDDSDFQLDKDSDSEDQDDDENDDEQLEKDDIKVISKFNSRIPDPSKIIHSGVLTRKTAKLTNINLPPVHDPDLSDSDIEDDDNHSGSSVSLCPESDDLEHSLEDHEWLFENRVFIPYSNDNHLITTSTNEIIVLDSDE